MCTLIVVSGAWASVPLVVAANRDEHLDRPAESLAWRSLPGVEDAVLAPRDARAGGTWLGLNRAGLFVGITNRHFADRPPDPSRRSRGTLVAEALRHASVDDALRWAETISAGEYNGFHLLFASAGGDVGLAWPTEGAMDVRRLPAGVHVATERHAGVEGGESMPTDRPRRVRAEVEALVDGPFPGVDRFEGVLRRRDPDAPMEAPCVVVDDRPYGTRSGMVLVRGDVEWLRWTDEPPCRSPFEDRTDLLRIA